MGQPIKTQTSQTRENSVPGEKCVRNQLLVDKDKILLLPLHIKLWLMKNFVKDVNKHGNGFEYLTDKFPKLTDAKLKEGTFIGLQSRGIIKYDLFVHLLTETEKFAWLMFTAVCLKFPWKSKSWKLQGTC
jgi:hypothetical protein